MVHSLVRLSPSQEVPFFASRVPSNVFLLSLGFIFLPLPLLVATSSANLTCLLSPHRDQLGGGLFFPIFVTILPPDALIWVLSFVFVVSEVVVTILPLDVSPAVISFVFAAPEAISALSREMDSDG